MSTAEEGREGGREGGRAGGRRAAQRAWQVQGAGTPGAPPTCPPVYARPLLLARPSEAPAPPRPAPPRPVFAAEGRFLLSIQLLSTLAVYLMTTVLAGRMLPATPALRYWLSVGAGLLLLPLLLVPAGSGGMFARPAYACLRDEEEGRLLRASRASAATQQHRCGGGRPAGWPTGWPCVAALCLSWEGSAQRCALSLLFPTAARSARRPCVCPPVH